MPRLTTTFGRTWWSQRWLRPLDELDAAFDGRLSRGRTLARDGGVSQMRVEPGIILATVKGSYWERYDTAIEVPALAESAWVRVLDELTRDTLVEATLLAGEMPNGIEAAFARVGARLFAESDELIGECACADGYRPCKHILATMYATATRLDQEPLLLFQLRGKSRAALLATLRARWADEDDSAFEETRDASPGLRADRYFGPIPPLDTFTVNYEEPAEDAALLHRLGQPAFAHEDADIAEALTPVYQAITRHALKAVAQQRRSRDSRPSGPAAASHSDEQQ
jgi:uncharacterized Zn finger protein